ncbi:MAG: hypothetical protein IPH62_19265 [Ignavibacteriae bacterium]|nr:hypothetical protein [Ignavibacteriota bacterium]
MHITNKSTRPLRSVWVWFVNKKLGSKYLFFVKVLCNSESLKTMFVEKS